MSFCKFAESDKDLMLVEHCVSSVDRRVSEVRVKKGRSLTYMANSRRPRMLLLGTPETTGRRLHLWPIRETTCCQFVRYTLKYQTCVMYHHIWNNWLPLYCYLVLLFIKIFCDTVKILHRHLSGPVDIKIICIKKRWIIVFHQLFMLWI